MAPTIERISDQEGRTVQEMYVSINNKLNNRCLFRSTDIYARTCFYKLIVFEINGCTNKEIIIEL